MVDGAPSYQGVFELERLPESNNPECTLAGSTGDLSIGDAASDALIASVRIYTRALTDEELTNNYDLEKDHFGHAVDGDEVCMLTCPAGYYCAPPGTAACVGARRWAQGGLRAGS